jgi:hypothetical protein
MEDLEKQIKIKNVRESLYFKTILNKHFRQLSAETTKLELNMSNTNKEVDRRKKNVESM